MAPTTSPTPVEPELETPIDYELLRVLGTNLDYSQLVEYHLNPDDPMVEMMGIIDKLNTLNEVIPRSVTLSLALAGKTLATEFNLVRSMEIECRFNLSYHDNVKGISYVCDGKVYRGCDLGYGWNDIRQTQLPARTGSRSNAIGECCR
jgi:hypothetical protein